MKITVDNYEGFLLDMAEGRLSAGQEKELFRFLDENSHLEADPDIIDYSLPLEDTTFPYKDNMKKGGSIREINKENYEQFCIARLEGDLSLLMERELDDFLESNPKIKRDASVYNSLVLRADDSIVFSGKPGLKKSPVSRKLTAQFFHRRTIYQSVSIAATLAILASSYFFLKDLTKPGQPDISPRSDVSSFHHEITPAVDDIENKLNQSGIIINDLIYSGTAEKETLIQPENEIHFTSRENIITDELNQRATETRDASLPYAQTSALGSLKVESSNPPVNSEMIHLADLPVKTPGSPSLLYQGERSVAGNLISFLSRTVDDDQERSGPGLWDLAHAGIRGINTIAGTDIRFDRKTDDNGDVVFMAFSAGFIEIQRSGSIVDE
ncbi:MAG: hypothetical protein ACLFQA_06235 [Bacteroidales bacterium]